MRLLLLAIFCLTMAACAETSVSDQKVQEMVVEKKRRFFEDKWVECKKNILMEVELLVDSILMQQSKSLKYDSLTIPHDTIRPEKPNVLFPNFEKPVRQDEDSLK